MMNIQNFNALWYIITFEEIMVKDFCQNQGEFLFSHVGWSSFLHLKQTCTTYSHLSLASGLCCKALKN